MDKVTPSGSYASSVLHVLNQQRQLGILCDVTVVSNDNKIFNAHMALLAASSPLFSSKLSGQNVGQVILDLGENSIKMLLDVMYCGISTLGPEEIVNVRQLAQSFEMEDVVKLCDGVVQYDEPRIVKPVVVDKSTNTEIVVKKTVCSKKRCFDELSDDNPIAIVETRTHILDDPEYEPNLKVHSGRKRGRPPGSRMKKQLCTPSICAPQITVDMPESGGFMKDGPAPGPRTRSWSGISKIRPGIQNILTKARESSTSHLPSVKIMHVCRDRNKSGDRSAGLNDISLVEETLVIEDGDVDATSVEVSLSSIINRMKHLKEETVIKNVGKGSDLFDDLVSKSFCEILTNIAEKEETGDSGDRLMEEWKQCKYCSQFRGRKKGRLDFHKKYCSSAHKCLLCHKPFLSEEDLMRHKCNKIQQESICDLCGKVLVNKYALQLHMKIHLNIRAHSCKFCGKRFIRKNHLDAHMRAGHTKERPYACTQCTAKFSVKGELNRHMLKHTAAPKYACSDCGKTFYEKYQVSAHLKNCKKKAPSKLACSQCGIHFSDKRQLSNHSSICQINAPMTVTHYVESKENADGSVVLCLVPEDTERSLQEITFPGNNINEHVIQIGNDHQVTLEEMLQSAQHLTPVLGSQDIVNGDQVFQVQTVNTDAASYHQLTSLHNIPALHLQTENQIGRFSSERLEQVQATQTLAGDCVQIIRAASGDRQTETMRLLHAPVPEDCISTGNIMTVDLADVVSTIQNENCEVAHIQGGHVYTQSPQM